MSLLFKHNFNTDYFISLTSKKIKMINSYDKLLLENKAWATEQADLDPDFLSEGREAI